MRHIMIVVFLLSGCVAFAQEASLQFGQANQFYRSADYRQAAQMYEQVIRNGFESPELYYNLGNSYFKQQNVPAAILNFERAKRLSPNDDDINYNLRLANLRVVDKIEPIPRLFFMNWLSAFINLFSSDGWSVVVIILLWISAFSGALIYTARSVTVQRLIFILLLVTLLSGILSIIGMIQRHNIEQNEKWAVIFAQTVSVKSAPDAQSTDLFVIHEGVKAEFLDSVGDWRKIRLADGKIGWLLMKEVELI